ncbi:TPA: hypothetical protein ACHSD2_003116 [Listeria monocytogenes]
MRFFDTSVAPIWTFLSHLKHVGTANVTAPAGTVSPYALLTIS